MLIILPLSTILRYLEHAYAGPKTPRSHFFGWARMVGVQITNRYQFFIVIRYLEVRYLVYYQFT
jgi:hypothetical protein